MYFRKSELDFFTESVLYSNSCSHTLQKNQRQWISVKCSLYCTSGASLLADHICHQNLLWSQLSPFVAFKPHFTRSLVSHNLRTILVTFWEGWKVKSRSEKRSSIVHFLPTKKRNSKFDIFPLDLSSPSWVVLKNVKQIQHWSWLWWSVTVFWWIHLSLASYIDQHRISAWGCCFLLYIFKTAKTRERTTRSYLDLKRHWWNFLNL